MPYILNGTYFTIAEVAQDVGVVHSVLCRKLSQLGILPTKVGSINLLTSEERDAVLQEYQNNMPRRVSKHSAARSLGISTREFDSAIDAGLPVTKTNSRVFVGRGLLSRIMEHGLPHNEDGIDWSKVIELCREANG